MTFHVLDDVDVLRAGTDVWVHAIVTEVRPGATWVSADDCILDFPVEPSRLRMHEVTSS